MVTPSRGSLPQKRIAQQSLIVYHQKQRLTRLGGAGEARLNRLMRRVPESAFAEAK
jgi:hypothetical protein